MQRRCDAYQRGYPAAGEQRTHRAAANAGRLLVFVFIACLLVFSSLSILLACVFISSLVSRARLRTILRSFRSFPCFEFGCFVCSSLWIVCVCYVFVLRFALVFSTATFYYCFFFNLAFDDILFLLACFPFILLSPLESRLLANFCLVLSRAVLW